MATTMNSLGSCRLHCRPFGIMSTRICHRISPMPSSSRTQHGTAYRASSAGLQKGWNEAGAAPEASVSNRRAAPKESGLSGSGLRTLAAVLALSGLTYLASASSVSAADLQDKLPHFHPIAADLNQLAESEDFWSNILRYVSYFFSVLLGTAYTAIKPIGGFLRKPVSAVITVAVIIGLYVFVSSTVNAMLGVNQDDVLILPQLADGYR